MSAPGGSPARFVWLTVLLTACAAGLPRTRSGTEEMGSVLPPLAGLTVSQSIPLNQAEDGMDGRLELLVDSRLSAERLRELWGTGELEPEDLRPAALQVVDLSGAVRDRWLLERSLARFEPELLSFPGGFFWLLTVDYSASAGSYNGPVTLFFTVRYTRLSPLEAVDEPEGTTRPVRLMRSLKTDWRIESARGGQGQEILSVSTRPDFDNHREFMITYTRLSFEGRRWVRHTRRTPGLWESDGDFPERRLFP